MHDQIRQDALLLLPPGFAVMEGMAVALLTRSISCAPSRHTIRRAAHPADGRHDLGDLSGELFILWFRLKPFMRMRFQAILRLWPITPRFCCHRCVDRGANLQRTSPERRGFPRNSGSMLDGIEGVFEKCAALRSSPVASHRLIRYAGRVIAYRVPVLFARGSRPRDSARGSRLIGSR